MDFGFLNNLPRLSFGFIFQQNLYGRPESKSEAIRPSHETADSKPPLRAVSTDIKIWGWSLQSMFPWVTYLQDQSGISSTNTQQKQYSSVQGVVESGCPIPRFRPYVAKVPWHKGPRAFLSHLFPRYGHYCGPNWSSGKSNGSMVWDRRPIDWLDFCCYCHDIGYDTHDQAKLLKADLAFLDCIERPKMKTKGDAHIAHLYRTMCIAGLKNILIPYRRHLLRLQAGEPLLDWLRNFNGKNGTYQQTRRNHSEFG
ncbi:hypothetical protein H6P81_002565 [Aristolochia fimbriata]|uniref:Phospholipase A2 family protein n=1 Tax=Aristolochia fimbriata TaxID=158543 RepID=A0AAV7FE79_ARIFI|nr:hypothetical protein H6P81_002565 [Aristolochia fimbriata]